MIGGIALFKGEPVTVIAPQKGRDTKENIERNFGLPHPEGYRKAIRLMKQAEKIRATSNNSGGCGRGLPRDCG